jgi:hypothetical protein
MSALQTQLAELEKRVSEARGAGGEEKRFPSLPPLPCGSVIVVAQHPSNHLAYPPLVCYGWLGRLIGSITAAF